MQPPFSKSLSWVRACVYTYKCVCEFACVYVHVLVHVSACICACMHVNVCVCMCVSQRRIESLRSVYMCAHM